MSYKDDMRIDENALDVEWLRQGDLETKYIEKVSEARKERDWAWEEMKTIRSELIVDAFADPEECCGRDDGKAATQPQVEAYYRTHKDYKEAKGELIEAEDKLKVLEDMKDAIHFTRTKALENLVRLVLGEYFAGPRMPRNLGIENAKKEEITKSIGSKMKRKKKGGK